MAKYLSQTFASESGFFETDLNIKIDGERPTAVIKIEEGDETWYVRLVLRNRFWTEQYSPAERPESIVDAVGEFERKWIKEH